MLGSKNEKQWNDNCDQVKLSCGGGYPEFWYGEIIIGGVLNEAKNKHNW